MRWSGLLLRNRTDWGSYNHHSTEDKWPVYLLWKYQGSEQWSVDMATALRCHDNAHFCNVSVCGCAYTQVNGNMAFFPLSLALKMKYVFFFFPPEQACHHLCSPETISASGASSENALGWWVNAASSLLGSVQSLWVQCGRCVGSSLLHCHGRV